MYPFLPPDWAEEQVVARIGLISDTHMPERCAALPSSLFEVLRGVDLILHAGDVGELWVLDRLSAIAPVVAVHGNDDTPAAQRELPYQQVISVAGQRILLWHSHHPDPVAEMASRGRDWPPKLARSAERGRQVGAKIVVLGHLHVPLARQHQDTLLVNPGALASGNFFTRQRRQTVALLLVRDGDAPQVTHVDLATPQRPYTPQIDWEADFKVALYQFSAPIVEDGLLTDIAKLRWQTWDDVDALKAALGPLCHLCWKGEKRHITRAELLEAIERGDKISPPDRERLVAILANLPSGGESIEY